MLKLRGSFISDRFQRTLPMSILGTLISFLIVTVDVFLAGCYLGEKGASAINAVNPIVLIATFNCVLFSVGTGIIFGEYMGKFDSEGANRTLGTGIMGALAIGIIYVVLTLSLKGAFFRFYSFDPAVEEMAGIYYNWAVGCTWITPMYVVINNIIYFDGDTFLPLLGTISSAVCKVVLIVILVPRMGIRGFGISALVQAVLPFGIILIHFFKKSNTLKPVLCFRIREVLRIMEYSLVDSCDYAYFAIYVAFLNKFIEDGFGSRALILSSVVFLVHEVNCSLDGVGLSMEAFVNTYREQGSVRGVKNVFNLSLPLSVILGVIYGLAFFAAAGPVTGFMGITDPDMVRISIIGIRILAISCIVNSIQYCMSSFYLFIGHIRLSMMDVFLKSLVCEIIFTVIMSSIFGEIGIFIGILTGDTAALLILLVVVRIKFGKDRFPLIVTRQEGVIDDEVFEYNIDEKGISHAKKLAEKSLVKNGYGNNPIMTTLLVIEELSMLVKDKNENTKKPVKAEISIMMGENITIVICDNGKLLNLAELDSHIGSLREYVIQNVILRKALNHQNLVTGGYNRSTFMIPGK